MDRGAIPQFLAGGLAIGAVYGLIGVGFQPDLQHKQGHQFCAGRVRRLRRARHRIVDPFQHSGVRRPSAVAGCEHRHGGRLAGAAFDGTERQQMSDYIMTTIGAPIAGRVAMQIWEPTTNIRALSGGRNQVLGPASTMEDDDPRRDRSSCARHCGYSCFERWRARRCALAPIDSRAAQTVGIRPRRMVLLA